MANKKTIKNIAFVEKFHFKNFFFLFIAGIINSIGVTMFLTPVNLYDSGISGTSMLISQLTPPQITLSICLILLNIPMFIFGLKKQGIVFTVYSIFTVAVYSTVAWLITYILPIDVSITSPLAGDDLFLCGLFGGVISGIGSGITIRYGGAIDGIEVMAVIFSKKIGITVGTFVMIYNVILYVIAGILLDSWILPLYSIITYGAALKTVDFIIEGLDRSKAAMIVTDEPDTISDALMAAFESGTTKLYARGGYSNNEKTVIYFVLNRFQISKMKMIVHNIDPHAFVTISEVADVIRNEEIS